MDEFRALLQERMAMRGAQARLAETSGIPSPVLGRWRDGIGRPTDTNLKKLAPALGMPYEDLAKMCGYLDGEPVGVEDPEWTQFLAEIEAAWRQADEIERSLAKRGTLALWGAVPSVARPAIGKRRRTAIGPGGQVRQLDGADRNPTENGSGTSLAEWYSDARASFSGFLRPLQTLSFAFR